MVIALYVLFFLSGAASLVYQVAWVRSLTLVFGGSHLAVTTVLAVFMGGLALGSAVVGKRADRAPRPLRLYGLLEIGIALLALAFLALMKVYPAVYGPLARLGDDDSPFYLSVVRVTLAAAAMLPATTLMGGTLPVIARFVATRSERLGRHISFLYGINTLGATAGTLAAGFLLLKKFGVTRTLLVAVAANIVVGLAAIVLQPRWFGKVRDEQNPSARLSDGAEPPQDPLVADPTSSLSLRLILWGAGVSGFCALGYEVLWTRMLALVVGTSTYSFTIILVAFLTGIALGSQAFGLVQRWRPKGNVLPIVSFGLIEIGIGTAALVVTILMGDLPSHATVLQNALLGGLDTEFGARQGASFLVASAYVFVPAFLMGVAFPLASTLVAGTRGAVGSAIGEALAFNTVGSILGAAVTGFILVNAFGIERSLQILAALNIGIGLLVAASATRRRAAVWAIAGAVTSVLVSLAVDRTWGRFWDAKFFAIYQNNRRDAFDTPEKRDEVMRRFEVLYSFEGANETISVYRAKDGSIQSFVVNGRAEASTLPEDVQVQRTLGHIPALLHPNPRRVFVLGSGAGMTLGSVSIHPEVESITLAEIEPGVLPATRTFADYNNHALDSPKLRIVFNDGRNFLATTTEKFDVITADPIHPWSGGAAYLYTTEYFGSVASRLLPGGIACQWLPLYELAPRDVKTVVRTFSQNFRHVMVFVTYWDAVLIGSNSPIVVDESQLQQRISHPAITRDLRVLEMASADDFLSYFMLGTEGAASYSREGVINTDDNLFLEFSAPESMGLPMLMGLNVQELARHRESVLPYLSRRVEGREELEHRLRWERLDAAARVYDPAHVLYLWGDERTPKFRDLARRLATEYSDYAPFRFLRTVYQQETGASRIVAVDRTSFRVLSEAGSPTTLTISAVLMRSSDTRAVLSFVEHSRRDVFGRIRIEGSPDDLEGIARGTARTILSSMQGRYADLGREAEARGLALPHEKATIDQLKAQVNSAQAKLRQLTR